MPFQALELRPGSACQSLAIPHVSVPGQRRSLARFRVQHSGPRPHAVADGEAVAGSMQKPRRLITGVCSSVFACRLLRAAHCPLAEHGHTAAMALQAPPGRAWSTAVLVCNGGSHDRARIRAASLSHCADPLLSSRLLPSPLRLTVAPSSPSPSPSQQWLASAPPSPLAPSASSPCCLSLSSPSPCPRRLLLLPLQTSLGARQCLTFRAIRLLAAQAASQREVPQQQGLCLSCSPQWGFPSSHSSMAARPPCSALPVPMTVTMVVPWCPLSSPSLCPPTPSPSPSSSTPPPLRWGLRRRAAVQQEAPGGAALSGAALRSPPAPLQRRRVKGLCFQLWSCGWCGRRQ